MGRNKENSKRPYRDLHERGGVGHVLGKRDGKHSGSGHMKFFFFDKFKRCKGKELNRIPGFWCKELGRWWHH